ncbi:ATP-binding protein [Streptomyces sp. NPDC046866]|uniref:ATP-binding protein n=1 Tax=Streptomyces sp. NPDC046866 TaxID=3154921 RepID=UPI003453A002
MSLPLTRRIARTALLLAAGAAPVVGAAGAASAAGLESVPQLGALTGSDATAAAGDTVGAGEAAAHTATDTAAHALPGAPGQVTDTTGALLGGLPAAKGLPGGDVAGAVPAGELTGAVPTQNLPLNTLPLNGLGG